MPQLILLSCFQPREYLLQLLLYFFFSSFARFYPDLFTGCRQSSLILQRHSKPNSGRPYLQKNKTNLCLPDVHIAKTFQYLSALCTVTNAHMRRLMFYMHHICRSTILQQQFNRMGRVEHGSVALPGVIRSGSIGAESLSMGTMPSPQQQITMGQMHRGHMPPLVMMPVKFSSLLKPHV